MKKYIYQIILAVFIVAAIVACEEESDITAIHEIGFIEYQYDYTLTASDGSTKAVKGLKRVPLTHAVFAEHATNTLPDSVKSAGVRQIEIFLYSEGANYGVTNASGASEVQISLVDTIADPNRVAGFLYNVKSLNDIYKAKKCAGVSVKCNINNTGTGYETVMEGKTADNVNVIDLSNSYFEVGTSEYEVSTSGSYNSNTFKIYFIGTFEKGTPYAP